MKVPKEYKPIERIAKEQGWTLTATKGGHLRWQSPQGKSVFSPSTPSDHRSLQNVIRKLKHKGLRI